MYRCYLLKPEISKQRSEYLFRRYIGSAGFTLILLFFVTIAYDWRTGIGQSTIMGNGLCSFLNPFSYNNLFLFLFILNIIKFLQIAMFSGFVFYHYKFNLNVRAAQVTLRYSRELSRVAIAMGATVGFSVLTFIIGSLFPVFYDATLASAAWCYGPCLTCDDYIYDHLYLYKEDLFFVQSMHMHYKRLIKTENCTNLTELQ